MQRDTETPPPAAPFTKSPRHVAATAAFQAELDAYLAELDRIAAARSEEAGQ